MAEIALIDPLFYMNGNSGASLVVGNDWSGNAPVARIARYTFTAPANGAHGVSVTFYAAGKQSGNHVPLRFYIGTDPDSHAKADADSPYTGELTMEEDGLKFTGSANILLLPNKTYYLWVFPGNTTFGWYYWDRTGYTSAMETLGSAGGARIGAAGKLHLCAIGRSDGSKRLYLPCVYDAAAGAWKLQS